jgi:anti-anti-sigma regulatory factor
MFRIKKVFENHSLAIYKVEGKVTDDNMLIWSKELNALNRQSNRKVILDFCQVWSINAAALEFLVAFLASKVYDIHIINPGMDIRNMLHTAGLSTRVLE